MFRRFLASGAGANMHHQAVLLEIEGVTGSFEAVRDYDGKSCNLNEGTTSPALFLCVRRVATNDDAVKKGLIDFLLSELFFHIPNNFLRHRFSSTEIFGPYYDISFKLIRVLLQIRYTNISFFDDRLQGVLISQKSLDYTRILR